MTKKDGVCVCACDKAVCERGCVCVKVVCESCVRRRACDKVVCVKDGV